MTETSVDAAFATSARGPAGYIGRVSVLVALVVSAATATGCVASSQSGTGNGPVADAILRAAAPAASLTPEAVVAGRPASVGSFCDALVPFFQRSGSYDQSEGLHNQAEALVKQAEDRPDAVVGASARAVRLSCAARNGFGPDEDGPDDGWAWNEHLIGQSLLLLGRAERNPELLRVALLASSSAASSFQVSSEGWGQSRYAAGKSAHSLWNLEKSDLYLSKTLEVLRQVAGNGAMPTEVLGNAKLELGDALMDSYERTGRRETLDEARRQLLDLEQQEQFKDDVQDELERLQTLSASA